MANFLNKSLISKILFWTVSGTIALFLTQSLFYNWAEIKYDDLSFRYQYLFLAFFFLAASVIAAALIWKKIITELDSSRPITASQAIKIFVYSMFGKYIPGQIWMPLGRIYLATKEGLGKEILALSILYETAISITAGFLFALLTLGSSLSKFYPSFNIYSTIFAGVLSILILPRFFKIVLKIAAKKFNVDINAAKTGLNSKNILVIFFYYIIVYALTGFGFFFFINSLYHLSITNMLMVVGGSVLAIVLGTVAFFAPAGLGIREGVLTAFLSFYFPIGIATLISIIFRIWVTITELTLFFIVFIFLNLKYLLESDK